ncbi:hypothetical protein DMC30DRAFT_196441 [Rhodotorula diobovata]|uniref:Uncharacterized protein n=1 Tax=Rhodotorula diobovata TaxID=5288 RepID=A0A5C5FXD3_9BASI|nr:hypothetical protein DMC30DRAFT_196441 [Rhodotorula diobovata]
MPWWGFASEYILYARAAAAADKLGYTFLEDDRNWNYGRLRNYFRPRKLSCVPPPDWTDPRLAVPLSLASVRARPDRLVYSRVHLSNLDDWTREAYLAAPGVQDALGALRARDESHRAEGDRWILEEGATLPLALEAAFEDQSETVRRMWALNKEVEARVKQVKLRSGLARRKWVQGEEDAPEAEGGNDKRRGPVIALHVRLGDKAAEYEHDSQEMGITNSFGNLTVYVEAAHDAYRRLLPSRYPSLSPSNPPRFSPYARPSILLITAEPDIPARLRASTPLSRPFLVVQTPEPAVRAPLSEADETRARLAKQAAGAAEGAAAAGADAPKAYSGARKKAGRKGAANQKGRKAHARRDGEVDLTGQEKAATPPPPPPPDLSAGYTQAAFNALPMLERVVHTQAFVRDLTVLAREADAAVVSGASNVGRLAMLIAGKEAVTGPRDAQGNALGGRMCVQLPLVTARPHIDTTTPLSCSPCVRRLASRLPRPGLLTAVRSTRTFTRRRIRRQSIKPSPTLRTSTTRRLCPRSSTTRSRPRSLRRRRGGRGGGRGRGRGSGMRECKAVRLQGTCVISLFMTPELSTCTFGFLPPATTRLGGFRVYARLAFLAPAFPLASGSRTWRATT